MTDAAFRLSLAKVVKGERSGKPESLLSRIDTTEPPPALSKGSNLPYLIGS